MKVWVVTDTWDNRTHVVEVVATAEIGKQRAEAEEAEWGETLWLGEWHSDGSGGLFRHYDTQDALGLYTITAYDIKYGPEGEANYDADAIRAIERPEQWHYPASYSR